MRVNLETRISPMGLLFYMTFGVPVLFISYSKIGRVQSKDSILVSEDIFIMDFSIYSCPVSACSAGVRSCGGIFCCVDDALPCRMKGN